jgi:hypothetical protein
MQNMFTSVSSEQPRYRSGAVARMALIPVSTLRIWERRYQVIAPAVTDSGHRLYTGADVERLLLIKQLIELGHAIGTVARLPTSALQEIADARAALGAPPAPAAARPRTAMVGLGLPRRLGSCALQRVGTWADLAAAESAHADVVAGLSKTLSTGAQADLLVAEMPTLQPATVDRLLALIQRLGVRRCIVVYGFAADLAAQRLRDAGCHLYRAPLDDADLRVQVDLALAALANNTATPPAAGDPPLDPEHAAAPPRRFDPAQLERLIGMASLVACECPRHLAGLVQQLGLFETYSAECLSAGPADAALHADLLRLVGHARATLEAALLRVIEAEAITLTTTPTDASH